MQETDLTRKSIAIVGAQWGDEGKGKVVDLLSDRAQTRVRNDRDNSINCIIKQVAQYGKPLLVRRYQGSDNAGHTLVVNKVKYALHLVPSGILIPEAYNLVGQQVFVNPRAAMKEFKGLMQMGVSVSSDNIGIAANAHVTLDYHLEADGKNFKDKRRTSTGKGVGPTATDKQARVGMRFVEFLDPVIAKEALQKRYPEGMPEEYGSIDTFLDSYAQEREFLLPFMVQEHQINKLHGNRFEIWEGAQGVMLDVDVGEYPWVTSSNPSFIPGRADLKLGVFKLYTSSAGTGGRPFVGQMNQELEAKVRMPWHEIGTTTGLPRDVGYFDIVAANYAIAAAGVDYMAGTCGDKMELLAQMGEKARLVVGYKKGSQTFTEWDALSHKRGFLNDAEPVFEEFEPWKKFSEDGELTSNAQRYVDRIQELTGKSFVMYGTGQNREEIIVKDDPWDLI